MTSERLLQFQGSLNYSEYYEENSQTYHHPSSSSPSRQTSLKSKEYLSVVALCFLIKPGGIVMGMIEPDNSQQMDHIRCGIHVN